jgi:hypothetical protein
VDSSQPPNGGVMELEAKSIINNKGEAVRKLGSNTGLWWMTIVPLFVNSLACTCRPASCLDCSRAPASFVHFCYQNKRMGIEKKPQATPLGSVIPVGRAKSGRLWKAKQTERSSAQKRRGVLAHMAKSFEEKQRIREEKKAVQELENEMKEVKRQQKIEERLRREDKEKRKIANELKSSSFQNVSFTSLCLLCHLLCLEMRCRIQLYAVCLLFGCFCSGSSSSSSSSRCCCFV